MLARQKKFVAVVVFTGLCVFLIALLLSHNSADKVIEQGVETAISQHNIANIDTGSINNQQLLVQFKHTFTELQVIRQQAIVEKLGGQLEQTYSHLGNISLVTVNPEASHINEYVSRFRASEWVELVEPNYIVAADSVASTDDKSLTWGLHNTGQSGGQLDADIDAPEAWDKYLAQDDNEKSESIIAVLDSGIEVNHQAFQGKLWSKDNQVGFNACAPENAMNDTHGHGTQVASVIAAVNPHTPIKLLPVKVLCNGSQGNHVSVIAGLDYVLGLKKQGVDIAALNMSWGGEHYSRVLEAVLTKVAANDILLVASAGNQSQNIDRHAHYPASYDIAGLISVAASNNQDHLSATSNYGKHHIDLSAPGENISVATTDGGYTQGSGTSLAAAYVTGTVSLVNSSMPGRSSEQYKAMVLSGVDASLPFVDRVATKGRLNANEALGAVIQTVANDEVEGLPVPVSERSVSLASVSSAIETVSQQVNSDGDIVAASLQEPEAVPAQVEVNAPLEVDIVPNHIMMRFTEAYRDLSKDERQALLDSYGVTIVKDYPYAGGSALLEINGAPTAALGKLPAGETKTSIHQRVDDIIQQLTESGLVDYAEPDQVVQTTAVPNDPRYNELRGLQEIRAEQAWDYIEQNNANPAEIIVGVIDTGVDYTHPDLAANMWVNPGEIAGDGIDNDGNGYVDDVHGWNAVNDDGDPMDDQFHGTHVAGTIGAVRDNSEGIVGVTPYVKIMALKFLGADGTGSSSDAIELLNYVHLMKDQYGVDIRLTNNSWGGNTSSVSLQAAIAASNDYHILFVAAAGNDGRDIDITPAYPAAYDNSNIISVASGGTQLDFFSNWGAVSVDIAAPGLGMLSTFPHERYPYRYEFLSGTSMAAPHVSGVLSLLLSLEPSLTIAEAKSNVLSAARYEPSIEGQVLTNGSLDALFTVLPPSIELDIETTQIALEEGQSLIVNIRLKSAPEANQTIAVPVSISGFGSQVISSSVQQLMFDAQNWDQWQPVIVTANEDPDIDNEPQVIVTLGGVSLKPIRLFVDVTDNDSEFQADYCNFNTQLSIAECETLTLLYETLLGDSTESWWQGWLGSYTPCEWRGVTCSNGHVIGLDLSIYPFGDNPGAELPVEIANLSKLQVLDLYGSLKGSLPASLGALTDLQELIINTNSRYTVDIPPELGNLSSLQILQLEGSFPNGIPSEIANLTNLQTFTLFADTSMSLPDELFGLTTLRVLSVEGNSITSSTITGTIPDSLGNLLHLEELALVNVNSSSLPASVGQLTQLKKLLIIGPGTILISELGNLSNLEELHISARDDQGIIPPELGNLANLQSLTIGGNQLTGSIPAELGNLVNLQELSVSGLQFSGSIPSELGNLSQLKSLRIFGSQISGELPLFINLPVLEQLSINFTQISGEIPESFFEGIPSIKNLSLSWNQLSGGIPDTILSLTNLEVLALRANNLSGSLPSMLEEMTSLVSIELSANHFSGDIPAQWGGLYNLSSLIIEANQLSGSIPREIFNIRDPRNIDVDDNALEVTDLEVESLIAKLGVSNHRQTIPPTNLSLVLDNGNLVLSWTPIDYAYGDGEYIISYSDSSEGVFIEHGRTNSKADNQYVITDAQQFPGRHYVVQSHTPPVLDYEQKNDLVSRYSEVVQFVDNTAPVVTAPADITIDATGQLTAVSLGVAMAVDNFDSEVTAIPDKSGLFAAGVHTITWSATDSAGNTGTAIQIVTVVDHAPIIDAPPVSFEATSSLTPVVLQVTVIDVVDGTLTATPSSTGPFGVGEHTITWTVTDSAGNTTTVEQIITVVDTTAPALTAPAAMVVEATAINTPVTLPEVIVPDSVSGDIVAVADNTGPFALGTHTITWSATDGSGNVSTAIQQLTVQDTTPPQVVSPSTIFKVTLSGEPVYQKLELPQVSDIFPVDVRNNVVFAPNLMAEFPVGTSTVVWTVTDTSNNKTTVEQNVMVVHPPGAEIISPVPGDSIGGSVVYTWTEFPFAQYSLEIGTEKGANNLYQGPLHSDISETVSGLPETTAAIYVRLKTYFQGSIVSYNDYVFNAPAQQYYPNHSSQIACYKADEGFTYAQGDAGDIVVVADSDIDRVSVLNVTRDLDTFALSIDEKPNFFHFTDGRPSSVTIIDQFVAVTYPESGKLRFSPFYGDVQPWTTWIVYFGQNERPVASVAHGRFLYVALYGSSEVIKYDISSREIVARLKVDAKPHAMALTSDGSRLLVTRFISNGDYGEVYDINTADMTFRDAANPSIKLHQVWVPDSSTHGSGVPNYLRSIVIGPNDEYAYVTANKVNVERGQYLSGEPLTATNTIRPMIGILDLVNHRDANIDPLTTEGTIDLGEGADPSGITYLPDGVTRVHALQGSNRVEFVNTDTDQKISINTGAGPQSMCATLNTLYVKNHTGRSVSVIDTGTYLNGESVPEVREVLQVPVTSDEMRGLQLFYNADSLSENSLFSCASCHDGGSHDGMTWDFTQMGEGLRNTLSLLGANGVRLGNFNWSGNADQIQDVEKQLEQMHGLDGLISGQTFTGQSAEELDTSSISNDLDAIASYINSLGKASIKQSPYECNWGDAECDGAYRAGARRFIVNCAGCHLLGQYSDGQLHDVGTITEASGQRNGEALTGIRTPTLVELWDTAPYFHDGSAATLEETIEVPGHNNFDLTEEEKSQVLFFLKNLDRRLYFNDPL